MKLDPEYPTEPFLYLSYTYDAPIGGDSEASTHTHLADGADDCKDGENNMVDCMVSGRLARVKVDPATSVAVDGAGDPDPYDPGSEQVLVNSWCQQVTSHSIGDIEFDSAGRASDERRRRRQLGLARLRAARQPLRRPALRRRLAAGAGPAHPGDRRRPDRLQRLDHPRQPRNRRGDADNPLALTPLSAGGVEDVAARRILS